MCGGPNDDGIRFDSTSNQLRVFFNTTGDGDLQTTMTFSSGQWYHIVVAIDTSQATASDRANIYVDGSLITAFATETYPTLNYTMNWGENGVTTYLGQNGSGSYMNGKIAEPALIDGLQLDDTSFASGGSPIDLSGLTFGTNGFWQDHSTLGADISGNSNTFTNSGVSQSATVPA